MKKAPIPPNEADRIASLECYRMLDTPPDAILDSITQAAANLCETPIALISLIDPTRQWFKSCVGMPVRESSRDIAFCSHAIVNPTEFMEVEDATLDERFQDNPMVTGEPNIRFYAGQPLVTPDGFALGTLCVIDHRPRKLSAPQRDALNNFADIVISIFEDRRQLVEKQALAEARVVGLGEVLEASINEIYMFDETSLRFVQANQGARRNLGYSMDELYELTPVDIKPEFTLAKFEEAIKPLRANEKAKIDFVTVHERKNGTTYPVEVHLQRSIFHSTPVFAAITLDITERTQTEEALAQSRLFLESAPDASIIVNDSGKVEVANSRMTVLFGYTPDELRGMPVEQLIPERYREDHVAHREGFNAEPNVRDMGADLDLFAVTKDGREIPIEVSLSPIQTGDGKLVAAAIRDVSARKETAEALRVSKEVAESATATKSRFLAAASHDLRQPLQSLGLYLSVLSRQPDHSKQDEITQKMRQSLDTMGQLLDALLDISKLDSGSVAPEKRDIHIQELLERIVTDNIQQAEAKGLKLECTSDNCVVHSDPGLLERVIENFVTNAIRYTERGRVTIDCQGMDKVARIAVSDSGIGIPENEVNKVFDEYYQLDNSVRDRNKGLGLGLSIVKHIGRLLDHPLDVCSVPGEGSTFAVQVPLGTQVARVESQVPERTPRGDREPIVLFVDDDPAIVDATTMLLGTANIQVHSALSGEEALAHIAAGVRPDIVVSDFRLPGYNGVEVVRRVRKATVNDLPIVLITGDTSANEIDDARLTNCTVLYKPVDTDQLISLIDSLTA